MVSESQALGQCAAWWGRIGLGAAVNMRDSGGHAEDGRKALWATPLFGECRHGNWILSAGTPWHTEVDLTQHALDHEQHLHIGDAIESFMVQLAARDAALLEDLDLGQYTL